MSLTYFAPEGEAFSWREKALAKMYSLPQRGKPSRGGRKHSQRCIAFPLWGKILRWSILKHALMR